MINHIRKFILMWRINRTDRRQFHDAVRNDRNWIAVRRENGVLYIPRGRATPDELEQAMSNIELAAWQRKRE